MTTSKRDYYEVLELPRTATAEEIKKAFRKKAKECHPDTNKSPEAEAMFKELGEAYDVLSDSNKKQIYDNYGHDGLRSGGYTPGWDFADGFPDLGDLFSSFFGGGGGYSSRRQGGPQQGDDLRMELSLDFMEAAFGVNKEVKIQRLEHCEPCNGSGASPGSGPVVCNACGGSGQIRQTTQTIIGHFTQIVLCGRCQGTGSTIMDPCKTCNGIGRKEIEKERTVPVPAGVDDGTRLRLSQEGDAGPFGGPPGDLHLIIRVEPDEYFKRDGYHIYTTQPVSYAQLVLGTEVEVKTLRGTHKVKIPAGTQNGHVFTLRSEGIPFLNQNNRKGDHFVQVQVTIPTHVSGEEKKLLERLEELHNDREKKSNHSLLNKFKEALSGI
ncbi:MAG: molecular chaperone DnaJ [Cyanobacteria bacterium]|nr:molecular chaperone DnaJ [Cyanobacteriota bacterium]